VSGPSTQSCDPVISHAVLRKLIGWLGISLPFMLTIGNWISTGASPPGSLSGYYYTDMRNLFVGGLCALGVFLLSYRGYERPDGLITDVAGASMILVALCPTKPPEGSLHHLTVQQDVVGDLHVLFAVTALLALGVMTLRFARAQQRAEVLIHRACATAIFSCVLLSAISSLMFRSININSRPLFICEVLAMLASGISWLTPRRARGFSTMPHTMAPAVEVSAPTVTAMPSASANSPTNRQDPIQALPQTTGDRFA
jgi:hypothetical protein